MYNKNNYTNGERMNGKLYLFYLLSSDHRKRVGGQKLAQNESGKKVIERKERAEIYTERE